MNRIMIMMAWIIMVQPGKAQTQTNDDIQSSGIMSTVGIFAELINTVVNNGNEKKYAAIIRIDAITKQRKEAARIKKDYHKGKIDMLTYDVLMSNLLNVDINDVQKMRLSYDPRE